MLLPILLITFGFASAKKIECTTCIKVGTLCHNVSYLFDLDANFRQEIVVPKMIVMNSTNTLFYVYEPEISDPEFFKIAYVNLDDKKSGVIAMSNVSKNYRVFDIDQKNNIVYVGGSNGIYNLDRDKKTVFFTAQDEEIRSLFYKGNLFFVTEKDKKIIEKKGDAFETYIYTDVKNFVIDNEKNLILLTTTGLFAVKYSADETVRLSKNSFIRGLTVDVKGTVYAWWLDVVYKVVIDEDFADSRLEEVAKLHGLGSLTFDNANNILFNSEKGLYRLTPTNTTKC